MSKVKKKTLNILKRSNNFFKTYQPLIQTCGIVLILIGIILTYKQIQLSNNELELSKVDRQLQADPKWRIEIKKSESNSLIEDISLVALNESYNIQKVQITIINKTTHHQIEHISNTIDVHFIKANLAKIYADYYEIYPDECVGCYNENSYPVNIKVSYETHGIRYDTNLLFNYHFRIYFSQNGLKFKTKSLEFIKYLDDDKNEIESELLSYNLASAFLSNTPSASNQILAEMGLKDPDYNPLFRYAYSNLNLFQYELNFVKNNKKKENLGSYIIRLPLSMSDSVRGLERDSIVRELNKHINDYDSAIINTLIKIQNLEPTFYSIQTKSHIDSVYRKKSLIANELQWSNWVNANQELINLSIKGIMAKQIGLE